MADKTHIITIAGKPGSGKSTASKGLAAQLGYEHFSSGDLFRAIGKERGIDVYETNLAAETESEIDYLVDQRLQDIGKTQDQVVIDSRLAWHWIPASFKVFVDLDLLTAAQRILQASDQSRREHEHIPDDPKQYAVRLQHRLEAEIRRYKAIYGIDPFDTNNFDLVVTSQESSPEELQVQILQAYTEWLK